MDDVQDGISNTFLAGDMHHTLDTYVNAGGTYAGKPLRGETSWPYGHVFFSYNYTNTPMNTTYVPPVYIAAQWKKAASTASAAPTSAGATLYFWTARSAS